VLLIGAGGMLGRAVAAALQPRHDVVAASRSCAPCRADLADAASLEQVFAAHGPFDAVVCAAGEAGFGRLDDFTADAFGAALNGKLLAQIRLALVARANLRDGSSITLTTGLLSCNPIRGAVAATTANAVIEGFVRAAAIDMPRGLRINAVSPGVLSESWDAYGRYFAGFEPVPAARVALAFVRSVEGAESGRTYLVH
jgi:NAD(P)-dependent dehydrogenase (short-subunit alcohol dehydrogenase family)